jgi:hypothetical protein
MKSILLTATAPVLASFVLLGGCGGGDNDLAGGLTDFSVQPAEMGVTVAAVAGAVNQPCAAGVVGKVFIFGGAPPYRLKNSFDTAVALDKTQVDNEGGDFTVSFIGGGCLDPAIVTVEDSLRRTVTVTLTNKIGT